MSPQEREQLIRFLAPLRQQAPVRKDAEADALIQETCAGQPDAAYLLVQRAMLLEHALQDAQTRIARLQDEVERTRPVSGGGFLDNNTWGNAPALQRTPNPAPAPGYAPAPAAASGVPGWLGNMATTAAGVVAGSFLFQGIEHLLGGSHSSGNSWLGHDGLLSQSPAETTIVNNYYDSGSGSASSESIANIDSLALDDLSDNSDTPDWM